MPPRLAASWRPGSNTCRTDGVSTKPPGLYIDPNLHDQRVSASVASPPLRSHCFDFICQADGRRQVVARLLANLDVSVVVAVRGKPR